VPRPHCCRRIGGQPAASIFKPIGIPMRMLDEVVMTLDEFEAIRLADLDGLYQESAAAQMEVSRPTFSRITAAAHRKLADAIVHGKALRIEGGPVLVTGDRCCRRHETQAMIAGRPQTRTGTLQVSAGTTPERTTP
jgi:predicted DNA-binding protein (UPF0251 family)